MSYLVTGFPERLGSYLLVFYPAACFITFDPNLIYSDLGFMVTINRIYSIDIIDEIFSASECLLVSLSRLTLASRSALTL